MNLRLRELQLTDYLDTWQAMRDFTDHRDDNTPDELWLLEHHPVFTQGQAGKPEYLMNPGDIPVVQTDRGGQITYHGPGQLIAYTLVDLRRRNMGIRPYVCELEGILIDTLAHYNITAERRPGAPGVYVDGAKIASLGLRVRQGRAYHGIALNVAMNLEPFSRIHPCGLKELKMAQVRDFVPDITLPEVNQTFIDTFCQRLGYNVALAQKST
jgi:lipoyl(octanoyl) transferase